MSHVTHTNESCHTYFGSCHTYEWVMSHIWMGLVSHMSEPCHTYEWVLRVWDMSHSYVGQDSSNVEHDFRDLNLSCHTYMVDMTRSCVGHDSLIHETWLIHDTTFETRMSHVILVFSGTWLIHVWDLTRLYVGHDWFVYGTWLIRNTNESCHTCLGHDSSICGTNPSTFVLRVFESCLTCCCILCSYGYE